MSEYKKNPDTCTHTIYVDGYWEEWGPDVEDTSWVDGWDKPTSVDVDLYHYKCTQCGKVRSY